jgi:hypothetical protein
MRSSKGSMEPLMQTGLKTIFDHFRNSHARYGTLEMIDKNGFPESQTSKARSSN